MASLFELEAMMMCRDRIMAKTLEVFVGAPASKAYAEAVEQADRLVQNAATEVDLGG